MDITIRLTAEETRIIEALNPEVEGGAASVVQAQVARIVAASKKRLVEEYRASGDPTAEVSSALTWKEAQTQSEA
jgi:hypothetical protein